MNTTPAPSFAPKKVFHAAPEGRCGLWVGGMQCEMPGHHQCGEAKGHAGPHRCTGCVYEQENSPIAVEEAQVEPQRSLEAFA